MHAYIYYISIMLYMNISQAHMRECVQYMDVSSEHI